VQEFHSCLSQARTLCEKFLKNDGTLKMLFNSNVFLIFALIFYTLWPLVRSNNNLRWIYLTVASFIFYGWWDWRFLFLIVASGMLDFLAGLAMENYPRYRRLWLFTSIGGNIGSLAIFKYSGFVAENLELLIATLFNVEVALKSQIPAFALILPVGISFYTFQSMSYTIDIYKGELKPTRNIFHFFAYLSMFPQLVAGPIVRASDLLPKLLTYHDPTEQERFAGLKLMAHGFFKKMVIADNLAPGIANAFGAPVYSDSTMYWWVVVTAFAFQIYCDFSGYSDIARGLAQWMGYDFPVNFDHPYVSGSMREFWTRWHISLSTWFRDYVYIPLGGSQSGVLRSQANMWIAMLISGFWHGAAWNFLIWGVLHATFLTIERLTKWPKYIKLIPVVGGILATLLVMIQVWIAWVFFRADTLDQSLHIVTTMFSFTGRISSGDLGPNGIIFLAISMLREAFIFFQLDQKQLYPESWNNFIEPLILAIMLVGCIFLQGSGSEFIYFQF
jgi:D-alanyl-lipoteichoic acid acyltransferase DltB (MBOAT superfamily)